MSVHRREMEQWEAGRATIAGFLDVVREARRDGLSAVLIPHDTGVLLEDGEVAVADIAGALLVETTRQPARFDGGYGGLSFPILGPLRFEAGKQRGRVVPGDEAIQVADEGRVVLTTRRAIFLGGLRSIEWRLDNLITAVHDPAGTTLLMVNDRDRNSGFAYPPDVAVEVQFRFELALAARRERLDGLQSSLEVEVARHETRRPTAPAPPS